MSPSRAFYDTIPYSRKFGKRIDDAVSEYLRRPTNPWAYELHDDELWIYRVSLPDCPMYVVKFVMPDWVQALTFKRFGERPRSGDEFDCDLVDFVITSHLLGDHAQALRQSP